MKIGTVLLALTLAATLTGCHVLNSAFCAPQCRSESRASSSLVDFLYPGRREPAFDNNVPELKLPVRVGLAFLPSKAGVGAEGLEAAHREELLERIRQHFLDRKFVSQIVIVPDYYLSGSARGFEGLRGVQRLYNLDILALVSYDQVTYRDDNAWSLGYLTIVGAYVLKGTRHDITSLIDLAVVDPVSRSILLRAGGTDSRHGTTTLVDESGESRQSREASFGKATDALIANFDVALTRFESDVRAGKANVRVSNRSAQSGGGGGGSLDTLWMLFLAALLVFSKSPTPSRPAIEGIRPRHEIFGSPQSPGG